MKKRVDWNNFQGIIEKDTTTKKVIVTDLDKDMMNDYLSGTRWYVEDVDSGDEGWYQMTLVKESYVYINK